jgi:hypothetical protein
MKLELTYSTEVTGTLDKVAMALSENGFSTAIDDIDKSMFSSANMAKSFLFEPCDGGAKSLVSLEPFAELTLWEIKSIAENCSLTTHRRSEKINKALRLGGFSTGLTSSSMASKVVLDWWSTCS